MARKRTESGRYSKKEREMDFRSFQFRTRRYNNSIGDTLSATSAVDLDTFFNVKDSFVRGITLYKRDEVLPLIKQMKPHSLLSEAAALYEAPIRGVHRQIEMLRSMVYRLSQQVIMQDKMIDKLLIEADRMMDGISDRSRKRWTPEEDEALIEMASHDDSTVIKLAKAFGRTPGAITTRISYLVGIERMSTKVAGRFIGWLDGEQVEGEIDGTVSKCRQIVS